MTAHADLLAEHFDLKYRGPEPGELEFILRRIKEGREPVLELGCGTGRMLVPLIDRGIDISGIDISPAMLDRCRSKCESSGLVPALHNQSMQGLDLPRKFGTVFLGSCGLGLLVSESDVSATFRAVLRHLRPGGVFSFEIETPPDSGATIERQGLWTGEWHSAADDSVITTRMLHRYDRATNVRRGVMIFERFVEGGLAGTEFHESVMRFWQIEAASRLLREAGFVDIAVSRVFTDDAAPDDARWLVVRARKP